MRNLLVLIFVLLIPIHPALSSSKKYHLIKTIPLGGEGGWDIVTSDEQARRIYITHNNEVDILDADSGVVLGKVDGIHGAHGVALVHEYNKGFITSGKSNEVTVFDLKTFQSLQTISAGNKPDVIIFEPVSKKVFAFNSEGHSVSVINPKDNTVLHTIELDGAPEYAVADGNGKVFVNIEDKNTVIEIDVKTFSILNRWSVSPGENPTGLAIDSKHHRLFIGCRNKKMIVMNATSGKVLSTVPIGDRVDATVFEEKTGKIYNSNGDGTVTVTQRDQHDTYADVETIETKLGSRTMGLDAVTNHLFIPSADFRPAPEATKDNPHPRPELVEGTLAVLIYGY